MKDSCLFKLDEYELEYCESLLREDEQLELGLTDVLLLLAFLSLVDVIAPAPPPPPPPPPGAVAEEED